MRIYTRSGDRGMTSERGGHKIPKTHPRIEANGCLDELNSQLGLLRADLYASGRCASRPDGCAESDYADFLRVVQTDLMALMSLVATPAADRASNPRSLSPDAIGVLERRIDAAQHAGALTQDFVLPGGCRASAQAHVARAVCRRAERALWRLDETDPVDSPLMAYINRLSDFLFALACHINILSGTECERWQPFRRP